MRTQLHEEIPSFSGVTFSLRNASIPSNGSGSVIITDINPSENNNEDALICRSEVPILNGSNWYLHPTNMSTAEDDRIISSPSDRGWHRNRDIDSEGHRLVRLRRASDTAEEGVFTCNIQGDSNTPRSVGIYYPSESLLSILLHIIPGRHKFFST